ncbi:MAG: CinA family protein [Ruminococcus sp.]|nr:CinA family protein [Ruminococcus sp.]
MNYTTITEDDFCRILEAKGIDQKELPRLLISKLEDKGMKIATSESCTGGLISKLLTDEPGVSEVFDCGVCSYANCIKEKLLGVKSETLESFGAVSPQTASEMAQGIRKLASSHIGISTTGIAGPSGGSDKKPVGTVFIGISSESETKIIKADFTAKNNNRDKIRQLSAHLAIYCAIASI